MRKRISITLREEVLRRLDELVGAETDQNRSRVIERILETKLSPSSPQAFLLVGDLSSFRQVDGRSALHHTVALLKSSGVTDMLVGVTDETEAQARALFAKDFPDVTARFLEQKEKIGTAAILRKAKKMLRDTFLLIYADNYFNFDVGELLAFHAHTGAYVTAALTTVNTPGDYGVVELQGKFVTSFNEKPAKAESHLVSTGVFAVEQKLFSETPEKARSLEKEVFPNLVEKKKLAGCVLPGMWSPVSALAQREAPKGS